MRSPPRGSTQVEADRHFVAFFQSLCFADVRPDGHQVAAIFGEQRRLPLALADSHRDRDDPPAVRHEAGDGFDVLRLLLGNGDEVPGSRTSPEEDLTAEFKVHGQSISNGCEAREKGIEPGRPAVTFRKNFLSCYTMGFGAHSELFL